MNSVRFDEPYDHIYYMENTHEYTHPIDTQEQETKDNEFEQDEFYQRKNYDLITEEEPKNIHPELYQKF